MEDEQKGSGGRAIRRRSVCFYPSSASSCWPGRCGSGSGGGGFDALRRQIEIAVESADRKLSSQEVQHLPIDHICLDKRNIVTGAGYHLSGYLRRDLT